MSSSLTVHILFIHLAETLLRSPIKCTQNQSHLLHFDTEKGLIGCK